jgi:hypothetical protein
MDDTNAKEVIIMTREEAMARLKEQNPDFSYEPTNIVDLPHYHTYNDPITFAQLKLDTPPPTEFVLHPCLPVEGIAFVYAATGLGKTLFTLNLAYAIAGGGQFLKFKAPKPRKVLYIDGEMAYDKIHERAMYAEKLQGELDFPENWLLITPKKVAPLPVPHIDVPEGQRIYLEWIKKFNVEVVIFDNLSMLSSIDENKSHEWKVVQNFLLYLRNVVGVTVIMVHHAGKDKRDYRGTSRMLDCANCAISLQAVNEHELEAVATLAKRFKVVYQKNRDFGGKDALPFEVSLQNDQWAYSSTEDKDLGRIVDMVKMKMTQRDIAQELGISLGKTNKLIQKARELKLLRDN